MSKRVLLIKPTSMGDLMHALPALTDAANAIPGIQFDWVVDEAFAEVPGWHPAVNQIICSAHRRWKKNLRQSLFGGQLSSFYQQLNDADYDVILDAQNNIKSAVIACLRRGKVHGLSKQSIREKPAHWAYRYQHDADQSLHAIAKQRLLFSKAIGYELPQTLPDYGIDRSLMQPPTIELPERFLFFVHNASWTTKLWPESHWHSLIKQAADNDYKVLLPCGNDEELARAKRLAEHYSNATALPKLSLSHIGGIISKAAGVVTCDTGLCHLAAMLGLPTVSFYGPTSDQLVGTVGRNQAHMIADTKSFGCAPCYGRRCTKDGVDKTTADCMVSFSPDKVWTTLMQLIAARR